MGKLWFIKTDAALHPIFPEDSILILTNHEFRISNNSFYIYTLEEYKRKIRRSFRIITYKVNQNKVKSKMKLFDKYLENRRILEMLDFMEKDLLAFHRLLFLTNSCIETVQNLGV